MENIILIMQQLFVVIKILMLIVDDGHNNIYNYTKVERIYIIVFGITVFYNYYSRWYFT